MPQMLPNEFAALKTDIELRGLITPIETIDGQLIDGRHRLQACEELGIEPDMVAVELGDMSAAEYVWSVNGIRRHLTPSQRAAVAVELLPELKKAAKERQRDHGGTAPGRAADTCGKNATSVSGKSRDQVAAIVGVGARYVSDAAKLKKESPEAFRAVKDGTTTLQQAKAPHVSHNSGENEWYTPKEYIDAARKVMGGIDLDPASTKAANKVVDASQFYDVTQNGLKQEWFGNVWLNPPYAQPLVQQFAEKLAESVVSEQVAQACVLVNNATETKWFRAIAIVSSAICFPAGRVRFWHPDRVSAPLQGQGVLYVGNRNKAFGKAFAEFGLCVEVVNR